MKKKLEYMNMFLAVRPSVKCYENVKHTDPIYIINIFIKIISL